eukprot:Partr_v1_DN26291_c1_g1_i9_m48296 putative multicellular organismal development
MLQEEELLDTAPADLAIEDDDSDGSSIDGRLLMAVTHEFMTNPDEANDNDIPLPVNMHCCLLDGLQRDSLQTALANTDLPPAEQQQLHELIVESEDVFANDPSELPGIRTVAYTPELWDPDAKLIACKLRRYAWLERDIIRAEVDKMLAAAVVRPSTSPWARCPGPKT